MPNTQNTLVAVFWDYPEFTVEENIRRDLQNKNDQFFYRWALRRFLAYGRVVDTFKFFTIEEIAENLDTFRLRPETQMMWKRLIEVYGSAAGK